MPAFHFPNRGLAAASFALCLQFTGSLASAQQVLASSTFPVTNEGWTSIGVGGNTPAAHVPLLFGGGGGGFITNFVSSGNFAFGAPAEFLGNQSAALGGTLSFRVLDGSTTAGQDGSVRLMGGGMELQSPQSATPGIWTSFDIDLRPGTWFVGDPGAGVFATFANLSGVLSNLQSLSIFGGNQVGEFPTSLDDVFLTAAVPEPGTWVLMGAGLLALGFTASRRRVGPAT